MKIALGIHIGHDRGACIIKDNEVIAAISQERLDRIKYSRSSEIPFQAIDSILKYCNIKPKDISCIGLSYDGIEGDSIMEIYKSELHGYYKEYLQKVPIYIVNHHDAHAYAVYHSSGFKKSVIFIADGAGDYFGNKQEAETMYIANNGVIHRVSQRLQSPPVRRIGDDINFIYPRMPSFIRDSQISIGRKYEQITHLIGFGWGEAGKTMGLASYGTPMINFNKKDFKDLSFSLTYSDIISKIYSLQLLSNKRFSEFIKSEKANIASTVQNFVEIAVTSIIKNAMEEFDCKNVCLGGGLFLNCLTNQKIIEQCAPKNMFILPATGDDGQAIGCAYYAYHHLFGENNSYKIILPYLGLSYNDDEILDSIKSKNLSYKYYSDNDLCEIMAKFISNNKIVAFHRGRTEIGPRALCHRSILANPTNRNMKDILNNRVKHREPFRPFAPAVIEEEQYEYFDLKTNSDYMLLATTVKEEHQNNLSSIVHVDNTARVQTVSKTTNEFFHRFLTVLKQHIGYPIILNTSFNVAGEPIVETPLDALNTFLNTNIDVLIIGNYVVEKHN